jgi:aminoglycoside phosphotransferase (APT) family kinase protein
VVSDVSELLARLESRHGALGGEPVPLDGGITNRNFVVELGRERYVLRLVGTDTDLLGISRRAERLAAEAAARLGIGPPVTDCGDGYLLTVFVPSAPVSPTVLRADPTQAARALRAFHDSGVELPVRFSVPALLSEYAALVDVRGGRLPDGWEAMVALIERIVGAFPAEAPVPCHDDLLGANLLVPAADPGALLLVDWEYAGMGHRLFDLGNLSVNNGFDEAADERLLAAYFGAPATAAGRATLALMRIVSDAREAAWGVVQSVISTLSFDFDAYARQHLERLERSAADRRLEGWLHAAAA